MSRHVVTNLFEKTQIMKRILKNNENFDIEVKNFDIKVKNLDLMISIVSNL